MILSNCEKYKNIDIHIIPTCYIRNIDYNKHIGINIPTLIKQQRCRVMNDKLDQIKQKVANVADEYSDKAMDALGGVFDKAEDVVTDAAKNGIEKVKDLLDKD